MKRLLSAALAVFTVFSLLTLFPAFAENALPFSDVKPGSWYYSAVEAVYAAGIMNGTAKDKFSPDDPMTRGQIVTILARLSGDDYEGAGASAGFADVTPGAYYADPVGWAVKAGITNGRSPEAFAPDEPVLRSEFAAFFVRFIRYEKIAVPEEDAEPFRDVLPAWAKDDIETLHRTGLVKGDPKGNYNPQSLMTRAEIATVTERFLPYITGLALDDYVIVYSAGNEKAAERIVWQIKTVSGIELDAVTDDAPATEREIVLGETNRGGGIDVEGLGSDGYEIRLEGKKIFINGQTADGVYRGSAALVKSGAARGSSFCVPEDPGARVPFAYPIGELTVNGNPIGNYAIVYPRDASPSVMTGVNDLVKYIEKACGVRLETKAEKTGPSIVVEQTPVVIEGSYNDNMENYSVKSAGDDIVICGAPEAGAMYGCYAFLKYCLGWYFLTPQIDYIRQKDSLDLKDVSIEYSPYFEYRINYWYAALNYPDYAAKTEQNGRRAGEPDEYGLHVACAWNGCHTITYYTDGYYTDGPQPCLNDEETFEKVLAGVIEKLDEYGRNSIIDISYADGGQVCDCDVCRAVREEEGSESGNMIRFINRLSDALSDAGYGGAKLHTLAYLDTVHACKTKPRDNVIVQYCTLDTCFTDPVDECPVAGHAKTLSGWGEICSRIWVWDYGIHFFNFLNPAANDKYEVLCHNIRFYAEHGVSGVFNQGFSSYARSGEFSEMKQFLLTEIVHNPYLSEEEYYDLMDAFIEGYYGVDCVEAIRDYEDAKTYYDKCDFWCDAQPTEIISKCMSWRKYFPRAVAAFDRAALMTDSFFGWESVDIDRMQIDYLVVSYDFYNAQRHDDKDGLRDAQERSFALLEKMRRYGMRLDENRALPKFTSPDEITESPAYWRFILNNDGTLKETGD